MLFVRGEPLGLLQVEKRDGVPPEPRRRILALVSACHDEYPSHGYRWVHAYLKRTHRIAVFADYVRKCFRYLGIHAKTTHRPYSKKKVERQSYPNLIFSAWDTVDRPRQVIVSDMTAFWTRWRYHELVLYFDVFTKQIVGHHVSARRGWPGSYYEGLDSALRAIERTKLEAIDKLEEGSGELCVIHTDQGSVYTSKAYNEIIREAKLVRSCSRAGKPTDNPVNESLNGWIKEELLVDFGLRDARDDDVAELVGEYVKWYNAERPCYALGYNTPDAFYEKFMEGRVKRRDTFARRTLDPTSKFLRERLAVAEEDAKWAGVGTSAEVLVG